MADLPFKTLKQTPEVEIRKFSCNLDEEELSWHRDREDRLVALVSGTGWLLQLDEKKPVALMMQESHLIPSGVWHRLIRMQNATDLTIQIFKRV